MEELQVGQWQRLLGAYDYQRQLERGYSVTRDASGRVVRSVSEVASGSLLHTRLTDGEVASTVGETAEAVSKAGTDDDEGMR
jgi:exonuclease VII large subunit